MAALEGVLKTYFIIFYLLRISLSIENDTNVQLLYTTTKDIVLLDTETGVTTNISTGNEYAWYAEYHYTAGYIYWSDRYRKTISRKKYPLDVSVAEVIMANGSDPVGISIDIENDHLYWLDTGMGILFRSYLDGSNRIEILTGLSYPMAITLDTVNKWIYYSEISSRKIGKCKFDGSNQHSIITDDIEQPECISLDLTEKRIYWTDFLLGYIKSAKLDGSDVQLITRGLSGPTGIDVHENHIYFTEWSGNLYKQSKSPGSSIIPLHSDTPHMESVKVYKEPGKCGSYTEKKNEVKRSSGYKMDLTVDTALSDDSLEEHWYRFVSENGDEMCTYPPGVFSCGTYYPIWLNGSLPNRNNGSVAITTCMQTENNTCEMAFNINITNCGEYYVYYMVKTPTNSSYCVGEGSVKCPDGLSSESGYYPGCTSSFPNSTVSPTVESVLIDGPAYQIPNVESTPSLLPVFKCNFDAIPNVTYVYDVYWYIDGSSVTSYRNISYSSISTTVLRGSDWTHSYHMNMEVQCSVRLRYSVGSVPGPFIQSQLFAAGLYPENSKYTVIEGEFVNIAFTSTVPIGCISSHSDFMPLCSQNINVFQPENDDTPSSCVNNIVSRDVVFKAEFCGIKLSTLDWNETKYLKVYGFSDGIYNQQDRSTYIQLSTTTITTLNDIWKDIQIPEIKVTVIDKDSTLTNRLCQSYNDPHITTFDGKTYHYMEVGEFVMYRNDKGPFWVHSLFTNCGFGWQGSSCHCGIAIRSRNSLFVLRTCETISRNGKHLLQQPITELKSCDDSDMLIEQYGNEYKVTLPIGTEIRFRISTWSQFITMISVKPSIYDINEAKGLCGVPSTNKDMSDDFTHRQDGPVNDYKTFADSWRITSVMTSEQLFIAEPEFLNNQQVIVIDDTFGSGDNTTSYCTCERQTGSSDNLDNFNTVQCNLTESTEYCSGSSQSTEESSGTIYTTCSSSYRKKRSVRSSRTTESSNSSDSDDVVEFKPLIYDDDVNNTDEVVPNTFRNGWNESNAYQKCLESIRKALPTDLYTDVVDLEDKYFIQSCVRDIELVGGVTFLPDTIGTMMTFILTEVRRNESLFTMKTSNGSQTVLEYISSFLCPNNCSDNGNCTSGVCSCYDGFTGDDCSQEISTPPFGISLPSNGLCTLGTRKCKRTNVYGDFQSTTVWYQIKYFQILKDTQVFASDVEILEAKYRNMFMVSVELPSSRRKRDTSDTALAYGYEISLSNDRQSFGESVNIIIYDESCYTCNSTSVTCTVLESCLESSTKVTNDTVTQLNYTRSELDTTTVEPTTMPEESTTISPPTTTTMIPTVKPCTNVGLNGTYMVLGQVCGQYGVDCRCTVSHSACMQSQNDTSWKCRCSQGYAKQNQQCVAITTTVEPTTTTVEPCTNGGLNRTDMVLGQVCGQYGVDGRCTVSHSACMQSKTDTSWKCRCSQGYAKQNQQCVAMPIKLFSSGQPVMVTVQESATSGFTIKSINFDEVSGFDVSNPTAEIKGPESSLFTETASTTDVTLKLGGSLHQLNYVIFVTVSVTIDNVLIRDFVEVRISVSSQGVIGKNIVILHGTPKGSIIGQICTSCITGSDVISVSNSDVYDVNMEGSVFTTKPINLDTLQSTMTIFNSTYILVYKNTILIANVTIIVIRSQYTVTLDEGSGSNTQVALLNDIFQTFKINTDGLGTSGDVINLGNITLNYEEQTEVTKTLSFSNPTGIMDPFDILVTIKIQDVNDVPPQFQQKPYNFLAVQSSYKNLIVGVVKADDPDMSSKLTYSITPNDILSIDEQGVIKANQTIPRSIYTAMVTVSDGRYFDTVAIVVNLLLPTTTNLHLEFTGTILENANPDTMIKNVSINGYKNYRFTDQAAYNDLSLDSVTGLVESVRSYDRENVQERQFKFTIVGNRENEVSCSLVIIGEITVNVIDVNDEPPVFINMPYTATVVEESSGEQLKMNIPMDTTDKDVNPTVSYSLVNHEDEFDINSLSGIIKTKVNINRETTPSLSISVNASDGVNSVTAVIVVTIEDINDNSPSFTSTPYNFAVDENSQIGKSVGTISANDSDIGKNAEITYQIHSDGGYFRINQTTGEITISRNLDREMNSTHKPIVYARDNGDKILSSSVIVMISVNDINDNAPLFSSDRIMVEFEENKDCSNIITTLTATDSDRPNSTNSRITYSLLSGSDDFQINPSTGSLRCRTMLNYENINSYTLLVKAQDNGSPAELSSDKTVIINVKDINDNTPTFVKAKNSMTIRYFTTVQRVIEVLNVVDLDYGANGMVNFTLSGNASEFLTIDNKGILKTKASSNPSDGSYSLTITATDMGSPTLSSSHSMTVTVSQLSIQTIIFSRQEINMTIMENSNIGVEIGTIFTEVNKPPGTTVTFEIIDEKADIKFSLNSDDGKVTLKGYTDREENEFHEFVVRVKNKTNDDQSDLALVTVQILDENDNKPIFDRENFYFEIKEDSSSDTIVNPMGVKVIATDADIGMNAEITYTQLESGGCAAVFTFQENSIVLTGTIDYEVYTFCKLTVKAYNPNNETMSSTVNVHINVLDVNDNPPEFLEHTNNTYTVSVREDTTINTEIPAFGLLKDKDSRENGDIELSTESSCLFDVRRNYDMEIQLQVKPSTNLDYEWGIHVDTCIIKAIDKGAPPLMSTATLIISITDVNDNRPNITSPNTNVNVSRDAKVGHVIISQIPATDADSSENGELRYSLQNSQYSYKFNIDPATGNITINSPLRLVQTDKITLMAIVSDKGIPPLSSAAVVTILITDDNPRPYLEQTPDINIQEHTQRPNDGEIVRVKAYDGVNANGVVKVCNCTFRLDTNRVDLKIDRDGIVRFKNKDDSFDREKEYNSKVFVSVIASDRYDPPKDSDPMIITINILDINDQYPRFTQNIYHFKVYQKAPNGVQIGTVIAIDKDLAPDTRYSINITESSFSSSVVSINETTGEITKSGDMTLNQTSNTQIKGWVYAQDNKDLSKQPPDSKQITITIEFDDKNNHTPTFQLEKYNTDMQWDAEVKQSIVQTMATDADSGVEGTISYSLVEGNSRGFFKIDNNGVLMLAYKLDSSIGTDATEIVTLTVKAMDGGIIPKYSSVQIIIRISGNNPGACIQGTEHSKQVLDITEERNNWSYAMYALVALLCIAIVCSLFFLYKWRTTPVPTISHPVDKDGKNKYLSSGSDYSDLGKRNTVEYSHSNQGFEPLSMLNPDPYSTVCDNDLHVATSI